MRGIRTSGVVRTNGSRRGTWAWGVRAVVPLLMAIPILIAACGPTTGAAPLANDQTFWWPVQQRANVQDEAFDPSQIQYSYDTGSAQMLYAGLVTLASDLTVQPDAAKRWDVSSDGKTYTFHLIANMHFSDGQPLRAQDFAYAMDRVLNPCTASPVAYYLYELADSITFNNETCTNGALGLGQGQTGALVKSLIGDSIVTPDDQTLVLKLSAPVAYFLEALTYPTAYPVEKSLVDKYPNGKWQFHLDEGGASGPFKVASYGDGTVVTYVPNPYWEQVHQKLTIQKVIRPFVNSPDTMYTLYRGGKYDYTDVPAHDYPYARGQDDFHEVAGLVIQYFGLNFLTPPFDNQLVRQAFDLALNKQLLADRICQGGCIPTNHIVPQGMPGYNSGLVNPSPDGTQSLTGNQQAAVSLLNQARAQCHGVAPTETPTAGTGIGTPSGPVDPPYCPYIDTNPKHYSSTKEIDIYTSASNTTRVEITQAAADQWSAALGLNVQEKSVSSSNTFLTGIETNQYGAFAIGWLADYPDPQDFLSLQFMSNQSGNFAHVNSHDLDLLMTKADTDQNPTTRMQEYHQAEQEVVNLVPWIPYEQEKITWRQRTWVHGFGLNASGSFPDVAWPQVYITQH